MKRNSIHSGLLALSLLCRGALWLDAPSTARAEASKAPWGTVVAKINGYSFGVDVKTKSVVKTIPIDPPPQRFHRFINAISAIAVNPATGKLYVGYDDQPDPLPDILTVWDLETGALLETIVFGYPINPTIKTNRVYVGDNFYSQLVVLDGVTNKVIDRIPAGQPYFPDKCSVNGYDTCITQSSGSFGGSVSEKTNRVYSDDITDGTFYVIDGNTDRVIGGPIAVGQGVAENTLDDVHGVLYFANAINATVSALDLKTMTPLGALILVGTPFLPPGCIDTPSGICTQYGNYPSVAVVNPVNNKVYVPSSNPKTNAPFTFVIQAK